MLKAPTARYLVAATGAALLLALSSCGTPEAVRQFVSAACDATLQFSPLVGDIANSCVRRKLAERPVTEIADASGAAAAACKEDFDLAPDLLGSMKVLSNYFSALNSLVSNQAVNYDKEIDGFAANLQTAAGFPAPATDAAKGLAKILFDAAAAGYQREELVRSLKAADADVTALTNALGRIAGVEYVRDLDNELDTLKNRYIDAMRSAQHDDAVALLLQRQWTADLETLRKRRAAALALQAALQKIQSGHHQLALDAGHWTTRELTKELAPDTAALQALVKSLRTASF